MPPNTKKCECQDCCKSVRGKQNAACLTGTAPCHTPSPEKCDKKDCKIVSAFHFHTQERPSPVDEQEAYERGRQSVEIEGKMIEAQAVEADRKRIVEAVRALRKDNEAKHDYLARSGANKTTRRKHNYLDTGFNSALDAVIEIINPKV